MKRTIHSKLAIVTLATATLFVATARAEELEHDFHQHHASLFGGGTFNVDHQETHGTLGGDYVYRFGWSDGRLGFGGFAEAVFAEHTEWTLGFPLYVYLARDLWFRAGPGVEFAKEEKENTVGGHPAEDGSHETAGHADTETKEEFLFRVGLGYVVELGRGFPLTPSVDYDIVHDNKAVVFGMAIGYGF